MLLAEGKQGSVRKAARAFDQAIRDSGVFQQVEVFPGRKAAVIRYGAAVGRRLHRSALSDVSLISPQGWPPAPRSGSCLQHCGH